MEWTELKIDGVAITGIDWASGPCRTVTRRYNLQPGAIYKASGRFAALPCGVRFRVATPLCLARARLKLRRRAYLAAKVPRALCMCSRRERHRAGGCAAMFRDPDGNAYCTNHIPF